MNVDPRFETIAFGGSEDPQVRSQRLKDTDAFADLCGLGEAREVLADTLTTEQQVPARGFIEHFELWPTPSEVGGEVESGFTLLLPNMDARARYTLKASLVQPNGAEVPLDVVVVYREIGGRKCLRI